MSEVQHRPSHPVVRLPPPPASATRRRYPTSIGATQTSDESQPLLTPSPEDPLASSHVSSPAVVPKRLPPNAKDSRTKKRHPRTDSDGVVSTSDSVRVATTRVRDTETDSWVPSLNEAVASSQTSQSPPRVDSLVLRGTENATRDHEPLPQLSQTKRTAPVATTAPVGKSPPRPGRSPPRPGRSKVAPDANGPTSQLPPLVQSARTRPSPSIPPVDSVSLSSQGGTASTDDTLQRTPIRKTPSVSANATVLPLPPALEWPDLNATRPVAEATPTRAVTLSAAQHHQRRLQDLHSTRQLSSSGSGPTGTSTTTTRAAGVSESHVGSVALKKATLSRPFGRDDPSASILPYGAKWVVEVSDEAEWDVTQHAYKYRLLVQRRHTHHDTGVSVDPHVIHGASSFTSAFTWRTIRDFTWLADALDVEFQGALLLPRLSIPSTGPTPLKAIPRQQFPVESSLLKHWLSDVLNGVRGSGEWIVPVVLPQPTNAATDTAVAGIDIIKSNSMETFLYRNSKGRSLYDTVGQLPRGHGSGRTSSPTRLSERTTKRPSDPSPAAGQCQEPVSFFSTLWTAVAAGTPLELCVGPQSTNPTAAAAAPTSVSRSASHESRYPPTCTTSNGHSTAKRRLDFSSRALGTAAEFQVQDSFMEGSSVVSGMSVSSWVGSPRGSSALAIHSELLFAEKDLALHYLRSAERAGKTLNALYEVEERVSGAWKRFAVTLANLFSYEKDAEIAYLGDSKVKRENIPFRKVDKETIDECLCFVARQKTERAMPGLSILKAMLTAYAEDLRSVEPSVDVYAKAIQQLSSPSSQLPITPAEESSDSNQSGGITASTVSSGSSSNIKQNSSGSSWDDLKEWTMKSLKAKVAPDGTHQTTGNPAHDTAAYSLQHEELKQRLVMNERFLRQSLTTMLRTAPFRISRIAWRFWNTEATQCAQLNTAAAELRCKLDIVSQSSVSKLLKRHSKEEKSDCAMEMEIIQRIVHLGQGRQYPSENGTDGSVSTTSINNELVEVDNDDLNEGRTKAITRDKALDIARHRIGRWNAGLAMLLMEAVGVDDPNVHVEETTRDLRMVRKYAIGLRECLNRCVESVRILREAITGHTAGPTQAGNESISLPFAKQSSAPNQLKSLRSDFLAEMLLLFSGTFDDQDSKSLPKRAVASRTVLFRAGIDTSDPFGWLPTTDGPVPRVSSKKASIDRGVGGRAAQYVTARDAQVEWLLSSLDGLLNEYYQRIEVVEGFVYMECVGIQLEKHFSAKRAKALSAFEKKTDLTTAVNMARKKRMTQLLTELQGKLDKLGTDVSHTTVKETKEAHLESKNLKTALHELAMRRLMRARETSTERVIAILSLWAKEEEINATEEIKALGEAMSVLERSVCHDDN